MERTHRQNVLHGDDKDVVGDQEVPVVQDFLDWFQQQVATKEQEVEAGDQVAHAEDTDARGSRDEDDGEDKPEKVAEHDDLQHVQVRPSRQKKAGQKNSNIKFTHLSFSLSMTSVDLFLLAAS